MFVDTHSHLYAEQFDEDRDEAVQRCIDNGIHKIFLSNIDIDSIPSMMDLSKKHPEVCFPMVGLHPCSVKADYLEQLNTIEQWLSKEKFYAIGEIGIDLYWDKTFLKQQQHAFRIQINWAKKLKLPIVIHARDSFDEIFEIVDELNDENLTGIFHCFTGTVEQAEKIINYGGFKLGVGGVVTFKNSGLDMVIAQIGLDHLVLETDSPYLAPKPFRGKRNESSYITHIVDKLVDVTGKLPDEIGKITSENSLQVFGI